MHFFLCNRVPLTMFHTIFFLFYYISFFVLSPIRFCYIFYNFEVIFLFFDISPRKHLLPPLSGVLPPPYGSWASFPAELFLRSRECVEFPEKKEMWSGVQNCLKKRDKVEKVPIAYRNRNFFLYIFSSFLHETSFSFFERKSCILLRRNSFCKGKMPKILRDNLLRTFLCTFSAALAFEWIDRRKVVF